MRASEIIRRARGYLNARTAGQTFWRDEDLLLFLDDAEMRYRALVSKENVDFLTMREVDFTYPASTRSVDLVANEPLGTASVQVIRRCFDVTSGELPPIEVEEVPWGELERWEAWVATQEGVQDRVPRVFAWSGRDFGLRPTLGADATIRLRYVGKRREIRVVEDEPDTLTDGLDDFLDLYPLAVAVAAKETKGGEAPVELRTRLAERETALLARLPQRSFETPPPNM